MFVWPLTEPSALLISFLSFLFLISAFLYLRLAFTFS